jgi:hypothetical protein
MDDRECRDLKNLLEVQAANMTRSHSSTPRPDLVQKGLKQYFYDQS